MNQDLLTLIQKYKNKGIVIDTNVAILGMMLQSHGTDVVSLSKIRQI